MLAKINKYVLQFRIQRDVSAKLITRFKQLVSNFEIFIEFALVPIIIIII
jgi:hypothetical protein